MRSWLYCPGNNPKMIINASLYGADGLVFDLEDAVSSDKKEEARFLLARAFQDNIIPAQISAVRINGCETELWEKDLQELIPAGARMIRIPKVEFPEQIIKICKLISLIEAKKNIEAGIVTLQCIFETPLGVENSFLIGKSSPRIRSYSFGAEDYCAAVGINRERDMLPLDYPRSRIASAAAAFGFSAYDTVWGYLDDTEGLKTDALRGKSLGFEGKSVIHPDQIELINKLYAPTVKEVENARLILEKTGSKDSGASAVKGRMIDRPVIIRAEKILKAASAKGLQGN